MKRILFLLFIAASISANQIENLEQAIMKSDLASVQKLLDSNIAMSSNEQIALINLATEIIRKRENKITINEMQLINSNKSKLKYLNDNKELEPIMGREASFFLLSFIMGTVGCISTGLDTLVPSEMGIKIAIGICLTSFAVSGISFIGFLYNLAEHISTEDKIIAKYKALYNARYNTAIKVRQLLYKIKTD